MLSRSAKSVKKLLVWLLSVGNVSYYSRYYDGRSRKMKTGSFENDSEVHDVLLNIPTNSSRISHRSARFPTGKLSLLPALLC